MHTLLFTKENKGSILFLLKYCEGTRISGIKYRRIYADSSLVFQLLLAGTKPVKLDADQANTFFLLSNTAQNTIIKPSLYSVDLQ